MKTVIIHRPQDTEREANVASLVALAPDETIVMDAIQPLWETDPRNRSIRGASLSQFHAIRHHGDWTQPLLVLEDDADPICDTNPWHLRHIPVECGAILLGGDIYGHEETPDPNLAKVTGGFLGTHAVVYNLPVLKGTDFLLNAYIFLASNQLGPRGTGAAIHGEFTLAQSLRSVGLDLLATRNHLFSTLQSHTSTRSGRNEPARAHSLL
jgi:hypothetical protein